MTDPTLTSDRLDELERALFACSDSDQFRMDVPGDLISLRVGFVRALIAKARRAKVAERERDALREQVKILKDGMLRILQCGYNQFDQNQSCPLCNGARHDHKDSDCLLSIVDRTMIDFAWCETATLAEPTDGGEA